MQGEIDIIICQLRDGRSRTRMEAARALSETPSPYARKDLLRLLNDPEDDVRYWATIALSRLDDKRLSARIASQLEDPSPQVRMVTAKVLTDRPFRPATPPLIRSLGDDDENVAYWASEALAALREYPIPQLISALGDSSWKRRQRAAQTLQRIGRAAVPALAGALGREDRNVQYWALTLLGKLRAADHVDRIKPFLTSPNRDLVMVAARALGDLGAREGVPDLIRLLAHTDHNVRRVAVASLVPFGDAAVKHLTELLRSNSRVVRLSSSLALAASGDQALKPILTQLSSESTDQRFWVIRALEKLNNPVVIPILIDLLQDEALEIRLAAAKALESYRLGREEAQDLLVHLTDENWRVRSAVADALSKQGHLHPRVFASALETGPEDVRFWVTKILGNQESLDVIPLLIGRFQDPSWPVRKNAAQSIARLGCRATRPLVEVLERERSDSNLRYWISRSFIGLDDPELVPILVGLCADLDDSVRENAMEALRRLGEDAVSQILEELRTNKERLVRETLARVVVGIPTRQFSLITRLYQFRDLEVNYWATWILGELGKTSLPSLAKLVQERDERIRYQALTAMSRIPSEETVQALTDALDDEYVSVRRLAVRGLGQLKVVPALESLLELSRQTQGEYLRDVIEALGHLSDPAAIEPILGYLESDRWEVRRAAIRAAGRIGGPRVAQVLSGLIGSPDHEDLMPFILEALGQCGAPEVVESLIPLLESDDPARVVEVLRSLARMGAAEAADRIVLLLKSDHWDIRQGALAALVKIGRGVDTRELKPFLEGDDPVLRTLSRHALKAAVGPERWDEILRLSVRRTLNDPADRHCEEALEALASRDYERAMDRIRKALRLAKSATYYGVLGAIHLEQRNLSAAIRNLTRSLSSRDKDPMIQFRLGVAYFLKKDFTASLKIFRNLSRRREIPTPLMGIVSRTIQMVRKADRESRGAASAPRPANSRT